ncbi:mevalonate kinase [Streptomyces qinzhouensis]|uniref:mevalonate kinase n=1 Tax=Streptomyces qinzhouensis TaxID=2599401 RepID=A0A5B8JRJ3_9ACTN|nr:mevalonate kinase [Streptomyces qinzhouensis]QDY80393.1 mevalonate kinase [Streptomyces qinzhouensis]
MSQQRSGGLRTGRAALPPGALDQGRASGTGRAHGKAILLGEHAVVYGAPAVAVPLPALSCTVTAGFAAESSGGPDHHRYPPLAAPTGGAAPSAAGTMPPGLCLLTDTALRQGHGSDPPALDITMRSDIPYGLGLGSSAACARALTHALDQLLHLRLTPAEILDYIQIAENTAHGRASGIDALATGSNRPVLLADGHARTPAVGTRAWIVIADSGGPGDTRQAVGMLRTAFDEHPPRREQFLARSTALTGCALRALARGRLDALGRYLTDCHALLAALGLSTDPVNALVDTALTHGALGAKMTGGGLGGCVIALTDTATAAGTLAARLSENGAARTWTAPVEPGRPV